MDVGKRCNGVLTSQMTAFYRSAKTQSIKQNSESIRILLFSQP